MAILAGAALLFAAEARAELGKGVSEAVETAMAAETEPDAEAALKSIFADHGDAALEVAAAAVARNPGRCGSVAFAGATSVPQQAVEIAEATVREAPQCAGDILARSVEAVPDQEEALIAAIAAVLDEIASTAGAPVSGAGGASMPVSMTGIVSTADPPSAEIASTTKL